MRSDADDPHDHPWNFFTYVISGGYTEIRYDRSKPIINTKFEYYDDKESIKKYGIALPKNMKQTFNQLWTRSENIRKPGSFAKIRATDIHQVVVDKSRNMDEIKDAPFTICLMGPRLRHWGFWKLDNKGSVWTDWRKYLNITPNDARIEGSE